MLVALRIDIDATMRLLRLVLRATTPGLIATARRQPPPQPVGTPPPTGSTTAARAREAAQP